MKKKKRDAIEQQLDQLDGNERQKLYKRALQRRKLSRQPAPRRTHRTVREWLDHDEDDDDLVPMRDVRSSSMAELMEEILEEEGHELGVTEDLGEELIEGTVTSVGPGSCRVTLDDDESLDCGLRSHIAETQKSSLAVGDRVVVSLAATRVEDVLPRTTLLSRPDPSGKKVDGRPLERAIAANIDVVVVVSAIRTPPLRVRLIDRYLVAIERGGAKPVLCVNKVDLAGDEERAQAAAELEPYRELGLDVLFCSASDGEGVSALRETLAGASCAFVGHSGVGKSSLLNALDPDLALGVGRVSAESGKGRHTTTSSHLFRLPDGTRLVDTPGIREFGLSQLNRSELAWYFHEFEPFECRFRDCSHSHEPGCGVREAAQSGTLSERRYETYLSLLGTLPEGGGGG